MSASQAGDFFDNYLSRHIPLRYAGTLSPWLWWLIALAALGGGWLSLHQGQHLASAGLCAAAFAVAGAAGKRMSLCLLSLCLMWLIYTAGSADIAHYGLATGLSMLAGFLFGQCCALRGVLQQEKRRNHRLKQFSNMLLLPDDACLKEIDLQGRIKSMNLAGQQLMNVSDFSLIFNSTWLDFWLDKSQHAVQQAFAKARDGRTARFSGFCPTLTGTPKWWDVLLYPVFDMHGAVESVLALSRDVSDLQNSNHQLQAANNTFQSLLDNLNDGFFCLDKEGRFLQINRRAEELLGYPQEQLVGRAFHEVFPDALSGDFAAASRDIVEFGIPRHFEALFAPLNIWCRVNAYPKPEGIYVFFNDITSRVTALQESHATETRLRLTQKVARFADWQFDLATNKLIFSAQAALLLDVRLAKTASNEEWLRLFHPADQLALVSALLDLNEGKKSLNVQVRARDAVCAGEWKHFQLMGELLVSQACPQGLLVGCIQDVSLQKQHEHRLMEAEAYAKSVINAVPQPFCVLDESGHILSVNQAWIRFFQGDDALQPCSVTGSNYAQLLVRLSLEGNTSASELIDRLNALLNGTGDPFAVEYMASLSEGEKVLQITALPVATAARQFLIIHEDISLQRELVRKLQESEARFREMVEYLPHVYWVYDIAKGGLSYVSPALEKIWHMAPHALYQDLNAWLDLVHPEDKARAVAFQTQLLHDHQPAEVEYRALDGNGRVFWIRNRAFPFYDGQGRAERIVGVAEDITEVRTWRDQMAAIKELDAVSGLPNRALFCQRLQEQCIQSGKKQQLFQLLLLRLDRLQWVRQRLGQQVEQELIKASTERLQTALDGRGYLARIANDEFAVLFSRVEDMTQLSTIAEALLAQFNQPFMVDAEPFILVASAGVASFPADGDNEETLISCAAAALQAARDK